MNRRLFYTTKYDKKENTGFSTPCKIKDSQYFETTNDNTTELIGTLEAVTGLNEIASITKED